MTNSSTPKIRMIDNILLKLHQMFLKWGINSDDWILALHYAEILQGLKIKKSLREGHLNLLVRASRLPWDVRKKLLWIETLAPFNSKYYDDYVVFQKTSGFNFDLVPYSDNDFRSLLNEYSVVHQLGKIKINLLSVSGSLLIIDEYLAQAVDIGEKAKRIFIHVQEIYDSAKKMGLDNESNEAKMILSKHKLSKNFSFKINKDISILNGLSVLKAKNVSGNVLVITKPDIIIKNLLITDYRGKILVCPRMSAALVMVAPKLKAIITDDGGILSHAAIIARELKIPCVIGTKIATKVLKDGDSVEVDASKGIVKIIKKVK